MSRLTDGIVLKKLYQDSVKLMLLSRKLRDLEGVEEASVVMASAGNKEILEVAGLLSDKVRAAGPDDIVIAVTGRDQASCDAALAAAQEALSGGRGGGEPERGAPEQPPSSLRGARERMPDANLALISVPGRYAYALADQALDLGVNPMIFSDNVPVEEELLLKEKAQRKGLIVMGPDCGTAILDGCCIGFGNKVRRGPIGIAAASGTGIQELACLIHRGGGGISHAIGVGGRDMKREIGGRSMCKAADILGEDRDTRVLVLLSKPADPETVRRVLDRADGFRKPVVACFVGGQPQDGRWENVTFADTMDAAAGLALALSGCPAAGGEEAGADLPAGRGFLRGLYTGGTLAYEALYLLRGLDNLHANLSMPGVAPLADPMVSTGHSIVDLGDDALTVGRAHPMIDPEIRNRMIVREAADPETAVLLLDFVLGYGSNADPAGVAAQSIRQAMAEAEAAGRHVPVFAHVCGTDLDPQSLEAQERILRGLGVRLFASNAAMVRAARRVIDQTEGEKA